MKIWQKNTDSSKEIEQFTIGKDTEFDLLLAPYDVIGSLAHIKMLAKIDLISDEELEALYKRIESPLSRKLKRANSKFKKA